MKHDLIKTENYLVVVSDDEIKENTPYLNDQVVFISDDVFDEGNNPNQNKANKKIIAHRPLNNALYLDGVDVLPEIQDEEVEKLAEESYGEGVCGLQIKKGYIKGYNKAKETYKYTEEDLRKAIEFGQGMELWKEEEQTDKFIQSLNQPKLPIAFECETDLIKLPWGAHSTYVKEKSITTIDDEGRTEWVGNYIF
jgi:hypothetical protein